MWQLMWNDWLKPLQHTVYKSDYKSLHPSGPIFAKSMNFSEVKNPFQLLTARVTNHADSNTHAGKQENNQANYSLHLTDLSWLEYNLFNNVNTDT